MSLRPTTRPYLRELANAAATCDLQGLVRKRFTQRDARRTVPEGLGNARHQNTSGGQWFVADRGWRFGRLLLLLQTQSHNESAGVSVSAGTSVAAGSCC
jgi:hypothetical protein